MYRQGLLKSWWMSFLIALIILAGALVVYQPLINGYFIQDEWQLFSSFLANQGKSLISVLISFFIPSPGQYVPITQIVSYLSFLSFKLNYISYFYLGIILHMLVGMLTFYFIKLLTKTFWPALVAAVFFVIAPQHFQATSWVIVNLSYSLSALFFLVGLISFFKYLDNDKLRYVVLTTLSFLLSLITKEVTVFIFIALPLITYLYNRK